MNKYVIISLIVVFVIVTFTGWLVDYEMHTLSTIGETKK